MFSPKFSAQSVALADGELSRLYGDPTSRPAVVASTDLTAAAARWVRNLVELTYETSQADRTLRGVEGHIDQLLNESQGIFERVRDALPWDGPGGNGPIDRALRAERILLEVGSAAVNSTPTSRLPRLFGATELDDVDGDAMLTLVTLAIQTERRKLTNAFENRRGAVVEVPRTNFGIPPGFVKSSSAEVERLLRRRVGEISVAPGDAATYELAVHFMRDTYSALTAFRAADILQVDRIRSLWFGESGAFDMEMLDSSRQKALDANVAKAVRHISRSFPRGLLANIVEGATEKIIGDVRSFAGMNNSAAQDLISAARDRFGALLSDHFFYGWYDVRGSQQDVEQSEPFMVPIDHKMVADLVDAGIVLEYEMRNVPMLRASADSSSLFEAATNLDTIMQAQAFLMDSTVGQWINESGVRTGDDDDRPSWVGELGWMRAMLLPEHSEELFRSIERIVGDLDRNVDYRAYGQAPFRLQVVDSSRWIDSAAAPSFIDELPDVSDVVAPLTPEVGSVDVSTEPARPSQQADDFSRWWHMHLLNTGNTLDHRSFQSRTTSELGLTVLRHDDPLAAVEYAESEPAVAFLHTDTPVHATGPLLVYRSNGTFEVHNYGSQRVFPLLPADVSTTALESALGAPIFLSDESRTQLLRAARFVHTVLTEPLAPLDDEAIVMAAEMYPLRPALAVEHARWVTNLRRLADYEQTDENAALRGAVRTFLNAGHVAQARSFEVAGADPLGRAALAETVTDIDVAHSENALAANWATYGLFGDGDGLADLVETSRQSSLGADPRAARVVDPFLDVSRGATAEVALRDQLRGFDDREYEPAALASLVRHPERAWSQLVAIQANGGPDGPSLPFIDDGPDNPNLPDGDRPEGPTIPPVGPGSSAVPESEAAENVTEPPSTDAAPVTDAPHQPDVQPDPGIEPSDVASPVDAPGLEVENAEVPTPQSAKASRSPDVRGKAPIHPKELGVNPLPQVNMQSPPPSGSEALPDPEVPPGEPAAPEAPEAPNVAVRGRRKDRRKAAVLGGATDGADQSDQSDSLEGTAPGTHGMQIELAAEPSHATERTRPPRDIGLTPPGA